MVGDEETLSPTEIEAITDIIISDLHEGRIAGSYNAQNSYAYNCGNTEVAHQAFSSLRRKVIARPNLNFVVVDFSAERLEQIATDPKYASIQEIGITHAAQVTAAATIIDNADTLGVPPEALVEKLGEYDVIRTFCDLVNESKTHRAMIIADDLEATIQTAEARNYGTDGMTYMMAEVLLG